MRSFGEMTVVSPQWIGSLAFLAAVGWLWAFRDRLHLFARGAASVSVASDEPNHRIRRIALVLLSFVLTLSAVASGFNAYFSYLPKVRDLVDVVTSSPPPDASKAINVSSVTVHAGGELVTLRVPDRGSGFGPSGALVWLPPQYFTEPTTRFPVIYLFHGSPGVAKDWFRGGEADRIGLNLARQNEPAILVAPRMSKNWLDDPECVDGKHEHIETHLLSDVIPTVDERLRTIPDRQQRVFAGMSAGGYCALNLGLRNRSLVSTILDLSGYTVPTHDGGLKALFGQAGSPAAAANSPASYASSLSRTPTMQIWLDSGTGDPTVLREMKALQPQLAALGMTVHLQTRPGEHTYSVWRAALAQSMAWAMTMTHTVTPGTGG